MNRIIFLSLIMTLFCLGKLDAQVRFGIKGGVNFNNFNYKEDGLDHLTLDNSAGWQVGILTQFKLPVIGLGLQPELLYTVKKANISVSGTTQSNQMSYFEIPVNIRWSFDLKLFRPYVLVGPYFGYAVQLDGDLFDSDNVNRFDWGLGLGAGVEIWKLQLGLRYSWGLQDISKYEDVNLKNNVFSITAGFIF